MFQLLSFLPLLVQSSAILIPGLCPTVPRSHYFNSTPKYLRPLAITPFVSIGSYVFKEVIQMDIKYIKFYSVKPLHGQPLQRITASLIGDMMLDETFLMTINLRDHGNLPSACHEPISETVYYWQDKDTHVLWACNEIADSKSVLEHDEAWVVLVDVLAKNDTNPIEHTKATFQRLNLTMIDIIDPNYIFDWPGGPKAKEITDKRLSCIGDEDVLERPTRTEKKGLPNMLLGMIFCVIFSMALFVANHKWSR